MMWRYGRASEDHPLSESSSLAARTEIYFAKALFFVVLFVSKRFLLSLLCSSLVLSGCSEDKPYVERPVQTLCEDAFKQFSSGNFEGAANEFDEMGRQHPYSPLAPQAELASAYSAFLAQKFTRAIPTLDTFIALHPPCPDGSVTRKDVAYAYYLRALCYYTDMFPVSRDSKNADLALRAFQEVIQRFPDMEYARDARFKSDFAKEHLACKEMAIARYYLQNNFHISAINHFSTLVAEFPNSILVPEALYRITEGMIICGFPDGAKRAATMLGHNFPKSIWCERARVLLERCAPFAPKKKS